MHLAKQTLEELSQDPETRRLARERADAIKLYEMELAASQAEARAEGEAHGRAALLLKQLTLRFGPPSQETRARVEAATIEQLDVWAERVLTQGSLDGVLG